MRIEQEFEIIEQARRVREAIGIRSTTYNDPVLATRLSRGFAANPHLNPEILISLALGGATEEQIWQAGITAHKAMIRDGIDISQFPTKDPFPRTNVMYDGEIVDSEVAANVWKSLSGAVDTVGRGFRRAGEAVGDFAERAGEKITGLPAVGSAAGTAGRLGKSAVTNIADYSYGSLKGFTRNAVMLGESGKQFINGISGQMASEGQTIGGVGTPSWMADVEDGAQGNRFPLLEDLRQIARAAAITDVGVNVTDVQATFQQGSGFLPSDEFREIQGQKQQDLLGTVTGRYGEPVTYTLGRAFADYIADTSIIRRDSAAFDFASGAVDGTLTVLFDPWNAVGGTGWSKAAIKGLPKVRNGSKYNDLAALSRYADERGQPEVATILMREAMNAIGVNEKTTNPNTIRKMFNSINETDVAIRSALLDEAGIIREGDTFTVMIPEFAKYMTKGTGRRFVDFLVEETNPRIIRQMFGGNIGHKTAVLIADSKDPKQIVQLMGRAITNPAEDVLNYATVAPHLGIFHMAERGLTVKRSFGSHTRVGNYLPTTSVIDPDNPIEAVKILEQLASTLPISLGTGRLGQSVGAVLPSVSGRRLFPDRPALQRALEGLPKSPRYAVEEVDELINNVMRAYSSGDPGKVKRAFSDVQRTLQSMLRSQGYTLQQAADLTPWYETTQGYRSFLMKDILNGVPMQTGPYPALHAQLISQPITLIDPSELSKVLRRSGRAREILRHVSPYAENERRLFDVVEKMEDAIAAGRLDEAEKLSARAVRLQQRGDKLKQGDDALKWINASQDVMESGKYVWKMAVLLRPAYVLRITPEEQFRVLGGGVFENPFDYLAAIFNRRYINDASGNKFVKSSRKIQNLENELDEVFAQRQIWVDAKNPDQVAKFDAQIERIQANLDVENQNWDASKEAFHKALIGKDPAKNIETLTRERKRFLASTGQIEMVNRTNPMQKDQWVDGLLRRLFWLHSRDVPSVAVAKAMLGKDLGVGGQVFEINGIKGSLKSHVKKGNVADVEEGLAYYFYNGPGRKEWQEYATALASDGKPINPNSFQDVQAWVGTMIDEINYLTGGVRQPSGVFIDDMTTVLQPGPLFGNDAKLLEVLATGRFQGKRLQESVRTRTGGVYRKNKEAVDHTRQFSDNERAPLMMEAETGTINGVEKINAVEQGIAWFFSAAYGIPSDILARSPAFRKVYWDQIADLIRTANPEASAKLLNEAKKAKVSPRVMQKLKENAGANLANATYEELDQFSRVAALNSNRDLLYDASRRGAGADSLRFVVAFADAWKEVYKVWAQLFIQQRGKPAVRLSQGIYAGQRLTLGGPGDIYGYNPETGEYSTTRDGVQEGFFWKDPTTQELKYTLPLSGQVISRFGKIAGIDIDPQAAALDAPVKNLNIAGALFAGFMPFTDQFVAGLIPNDPAWNGIRDFFFPFGDPLDPDTPEGSGDILQKLLIPTSVRKMAVILGGSDSPRILQYIANLLNNAETDMAFQNTRNHAMKLLMSEGQYDSSKAGYAQLERDADKIARVIYFTRGIGQFMGPAAPGVRYSPSIGELLEDGEFVRTGNVHGALLAQELNDNIRLAIEQGRPIVDAYIDLLDKYGPNVWLSFSANTESKFPGAEASREWYEWSQQNGDVIETFKEVGAYFGPTGDYDQNSRQRMLASGVYKTKSPEDLRDDAASALAYMAYSRFRDGLPPEPARTKQQRDLLAGYRNELEVQMGVTMFSQESRELRNRQISQLEDIVNRAINGEPLATKLAQTESGKYLVNYMAARESAIFYAQNNLGLSRDGWKTSLRGAPVREGLRELGNVYAAQNPAFGRMWQFILEREMVDAEQDVIVVEENAVPQVGR
jgi:hypothetical protein